MAIELYGYDKAKVLAQVKGEFTLSFNSILTKRNIFRNRLRLYNEALIDKSMIKSNLLYQTMQTFMAVDYTDEISVEFTSRQIWNNTQGYNLQNLAEFDQEEMNVSEMNYWVKRSKLFYGVGIRTLEGYDKKRQCPLWAVRDPKAWLPDPNIAFVDNKVNSRFHGFQVEDYIENLMQHEGYDVEALKRLQTDIQGEIQLNKVAQLQNRGIIPQTENTLPNAIKEEVEAGRTKFALYHHMTRLDNGQPYIITTDGTFAEILRFIPIDPVCTEEEENMFLIDFPVVLNYFSPYPGDPFGVCVPDLIEDKQRAYSVVMNLNKIKITREALGGLYVYDTNTIKNAADLQVPNPNGPKFIGADGKGGNLANSIMEVQQSRVNPDAINFPNIIMNEVFMSTGMDARAMGISGGSNLTATENQRVQANQNIKLLLNNKINGRGEKFFRQTWYRCYKEYFSAKDEKNVRINTGFRSMMIKMKKEDFITKEDPEISIKNKSDQEANRAKKKVDFSAYYPLAIQDPTKSSISKKYIERYYLELMEIDRNTIDIFTMNDGAADEIQANIDLELINRNEDPIPVQEGQDHMVFITVYMSGLPTQARARAIEKRKLAIIEEKKNQAMQGMMPPQGSTTENSAANTSVGMAMNAANQSNTNQTQSLGLPQQQ